MYIPIAYHVSSVSRTTGFVLGNGPVESRLKSYAAPAATVFSYDNFKDGPYLFEGDGTTGPIVMPDRALYATRSFSRPFSDGTDATTATTLQVASMSSAVIGVMSGLNPTVFASQ